MNSRNDEVKRVRGRRAPSHRIRTWAFGAVAAAGLLACTQSDVVTPVASVPDSVVITLEASTTDEAMESISVLTLTVGESADLAATAYNALGFAVSDVAFDWQSDAPGVASVSVDGVVEGLDAGSARISVFAADVSAAVEVTVTPASVPPPASTSAR